MDIVVESFNKIKSNIIDSKIKNSAQIIAVSKTFDLKHIMPLIDYGHLHYGENKVQEAESKWKEIKKIKIKLLRLFKKLLHPICPMKNQFQNLKVANL